MRWVGDVVIWTLAAFSLAQTVFFFRKFRAMRRQANAHFDRALLFSEHSKHIFEASTTLLRHVHKCPVCQTWGVRHCPEGIGLQFDFGEAMRTANDELGTVPHA